MLADQQADTPADLLSSAICVDDSLFIHPGADNSLVVWNMDSQKELGRLVGHDKQITAVAAKGSLAVSTQADGPTRLWNLETMHCTTTLPDPISAAYACYMEGKMLIGSAHGPIKLWDAATSAPVALPGLEGHNSAVYCIKASANTVLSSSADKTVRLWDLRTVGKCVRTMEGHTGIVYSVDMDRNCRTAVSGSKDTRVRLWDLGSGRCSATFEGHSSEVRDVMMHESGDNFLCSDIDLTVNAWAVGSSKAIMRVDLKAFFLPRKWMSRFFASRDLSTVAHCGINTGTGQLELRLWR